MTVSAYNKNEIGNPFRGSLSHFFRGAILQQPLSLCWGHDEPALPAIGKLAFAQRSGAMKAPVGLLSDRTVLR